MQLKMAEEQNKQVGYCVKCKSKWEMKNPAEKRSKTNRLKL